MGEGVNLSGGEQSEYVFELVRDGDINECAEIIAKYVGETRISRDTVKMRLKDPNFMTVVGKSGNKIKGLINGLIPPSLAQSAKIIYVVVVDQESATKGLPAILIDEFISELRRRFPNVPAVDVDFASKDTNAVAMYSIKGFCVEGFMKDGVSGTDIVTLRRRFSQNPSRTPVA